MLVRQYSKRLLNIHTIVTYSAIAFYLQNSVTHSVIAFQVSSKPYSTTLHNQSQFSSLDNNFSFLQLRGGGDRTTSTITNQLRMTSTTQTSEQPLLKNELSVEEKLTALRSKMKELDLDAYLVPTDDPHLSEYVPQAYMRRKFLSGFGGSAGTALVTADEALLWTDSRYYSEASLQLDDDYWTLMKQGLPKVPSISKYVSGLAAKKYGSENKTFKLGIDPFVHPASFAREMNDSFETAKETSDIEIGLDDDDIMIGEICTLDGTRNLVDEIWTDRPPIPQSKFRVHPIEYSGMSVKQKVEIIREQMKEKKATLAVFTTLDDVAYLCNIRCKGDIETCPVGISYATVSMNSITLFCDPVKVQSDEVEAHLKEGDVVIKGYNEVTNEINEHVDNNPRAKVWIDKTRSNFALSSLIPDKALIDSQNAITPMKACKNKAELEGMRRSHVVDGAAMANFMAWLEDTILNQNRVVSEVEIDEVLTGFRAQQPGFVEVSFPTIAGVGSNGAIIHYRATEGSNLLKHLSPDDPILIDSGGQYLYGTTDVTRTWHFGAPTQEFKENYTRVLNGNIGVDTMIFPEGTPGFVLDVFARKSLWEGGKDYGHGTGHGVGAALNVHEGPHSISPRWANKEVLKKGMVVSNEPGFYEDGVSGIRIENLLEVSYVNDDDNLAYKNISENKNDVEKKKFLCMKKLTMIPIQKNLIELSFMTEKELDWLDAYHKEVYQKISPLLEEGSPGLLWLSKACEQIKRI
mmetsp:Transcript_2214/g.2659  ORF Transcript_2214/g.2659 Transcript_2214/m.2659 type:complete len:746 (+) Transcript_2214:170-2407(+)